MTLQPKIQNSKPETASGAAYQPRLAWFAGIGSLWVFVLVLLGAFTTSYNAGMAFPDWPLSNGSINPEGWLSDLAMFLEHSHRLSGALMGLITIAIATWIFLREPRRWVRRTAGFAVALVIVQGLFGGLRVLFDPHQIESVGASVGQLFAMVHGVLAQVYVCTLAALAIGLSRPWIEGATTAPAEPSPGLRRLALACCGLLVAQLAIAAVMRHSHAGLAIPTFPASGADGAWLPPAWNFRIGIHFAHRVMAVVLTVALVWLAVATERDAGTTRAHRQTALIIVALLVLQITLGAVTVLTRRDPNFTTFHVIVGLVTLVTTFGLTWFLHRNRIERSTAGRATASSDWPGRSRPAGAVES